MPTVLPIRCFRPARHFARKFIRKPSDFPSVGMEEIKRKLAKKSVYAISQPELFGGSFETGKKRFSTLLRKGLIYPETKASFYIYQISFNGKNQNGLVCLQWLKDVSEKNILLHEKTRLQSSAFLGQRIEQLKLSFTPIYSIAPDEDKSLESMLSRTAKQLKKEISIQTQPNEVHTIYRIRDNELEAEIGMFLQTIPTTYLADGHHRLSVLQKQAGVAQDSFFPTIIFPSNSTRIQSFAKIISGFNQRQVAQFFQQIETNYQQELNPLLEKASVYYNGRWHPVVSSLNTIAFYQTFNNTINDCFELKDQAESEKILFLKDIYGPLSIANFTDKSAGQLAIRFHPFTVSDIIQIANEGLQLPPKSTLFYPKPRAGLFITRV